MLDGLIDRLRAARPGDRGRLVREYSAAAGCPTSRTYRRLREAGWSSGRRRRSDAGATQVSDDALDLLAAALLTGVRKTGQRTMTVPIARQSLAASGVAFGGLSDTRLAHLLRARRLDLATQQRGLLTHTTMRVPAPNWAHQADPSACLIRYLPQAKKMEHVEAPYKNKAREMTVWRYLLVDCNSGAIHLDYYTQAGELPETMWRFLWDAWSYSEDRDWHGLPRFLVWDKGSATSELERGLRGLGVEPIVHAAGNARAQGAVESAQWAVERAFEARLWLQTADTLGELRAAARRWVRAYIADDIPGLDSRLTRGRSRESRLSRWQRIAPAELREPPASGRDLAVFEAVTRRVRGDLTVRYRHPVTRRMERYRVGTLQGVHVGDEVTLQPSLRDAEGEVLVSSAYDGERVEERMLPLAEDADGYLADAPVMGVEYRGTARTQVERDGERLRGLAGAQKPGVSAMGGRAKALDAAGPGGDGTVIRFPARRGTAAEPEAPSAERLAVADAARYLRERLGEAWTPELFGELAGRWPRGATAAELDAWAAELGREAETG